MDILLSALAVIGMMGADRFRGAGGTYFIKCDWYASVFFAFIMYVLLGMPDMFYIPIFVAAYKLGESVGWGSPLGQFLFDRGPQHDNDYEEWQKGKILKIPAVALIVRGFMWGAPVSIAVFNAVPDLALAGIVLASFTISFLLAPAVTKLFAERSDAWGVQEEIRGGLQVLPVALYLLV